MPKHQGNNTDSGKSDAQGKEKCTLVIWMLYSTFSLKHNGHIVFMVHTVSFSLTEPPRNPPTVSSC